MSIKIYSALNDKKLTGHIYDFYFDYLFTVIGDSCNPTEIFEDTDLFHPDIMVISETVGDMKLLDFIKSMTKRFEKVPYFVVMTDREIIPELDSILGKFAVYYVTADCDGSDVIQRIYDVACDKFYDFNLEKIQCNCVFEYLTKRFLSGYGIPNDYKGTEYLVKIISLIYRHFSFDNFDLERLYSYLARKFYTTSFRVRMKVRHLIELGWYLKYQLDKDNIYTSPFNSLENCPSESEFFSIVTKLVHDSFEEYLIRNADKLSSEGQMILMDEFDDDILVF